MTIVMFYRDSVAGAVVCGTRESSNLDSTGEDVSFQVLGCRSAWDWR